MSDPDLQHTIATPAAPPALIYIIRHAEKPPDSSDDDTADSSPENSGSGSGPFGVDLDGNQNSDSLIPLGWQRAGALAQLFDPSNGLFASPLLTSPTVIGVPKYGNPPQHRTYQTVSPVALKLGLTPTVTVEVGKETDLVAWLLQRSGENVLICWEHKHIIDITDALGPLISGGDVPGPWPSDRFDIVVALIPNAAEAGTYTCFQVPELLLAGDSSDPIPASTSP